MRLRLKWVEVGKPSDVDKASSFPTVYHGICGTCQGYLIILERWRWIGVSKSSPPKPGSRGIPAGRWVAPIFCTRCYESMAWGFNAVHSLSGTHASSEMTEISQMAGSTNHSGCIVPWAICDRWIFTVGTRRRATRSGGRNWPRRGTGGESGTWAWSKGR